MDEMDERANVAQQRIARFWRSCPRVINTHDPITLEGVCGARAPYILLHIGLSRRVHAFELDALLRWCGDARTTPPTHPLTGKPLGLDVWLQLTRLARRHARELPCRCVWSHDDAPAPPRSTEAQRLIIAYHLTHYALLDEASTSDVAATLVGELVRALSGMFLVNNAGTAAENDALCNVLRDFLCTLQIVINSTRSHTPAFELDDITRYTPQRLVHLQAVLAAYALAHRTASAHQNFSSIRACIPALAAALAVVAHITGPQPRAR